MTRRIRSLIFLLIVHLSYVVPAVTQEVLHWRVLPNSPVPEWYARHDDCYFVNPRLGWVVNGGGNIYRTTDGGETWEHQFQVPSYLRSVGFSDSLHGWVGTLDGEHPLYRTTDSGVTWAEVWNIPEPRPAGVCGLWVVNQSVIYGSGKYTEPARMIKSTDGGGTWASLDLSPYAATLIDCYFPTADSGFVVGGRGRFICGSCSGDSISAVILFTSDGGTTWQTRWQGRRRNEWGWKISFPSRKVGYVSLEREVDSAFFVKTTDGGVTWTDKLFAPGGYDEEGIGFLTSTVGWLGGWGGLTYKTTDGGDSWQVDSTVESWYYSNRFRFLSDTLAYAVGRRVYKYSRESANWAAVKTGLTNTNVHAFVVSPNGAGGTNLFAGTDGGVFLSTNNGTGWSQVNSGLTNTAVMSLAVSGTNLFAGTNGGVFLSANNGISWTAVNSGLSTGVMSLAVSGTNLFAGTYGGVFFSTNNGTSWINTYLNSYVPALALSGKNLLAGTYGGIYVSNNDGASWKWVSMNENTVNAFAVSGTNLFAGTDNGGVLLSTNNGTSWTAANTGLTSNNVHALVVSDANVFAGTAFGGVFFSSNNGASWTNTNLTSTDVGALAVSDTNLFAGTGSGVWRYRVPVTVSLVEEIKSREVPNRFQLEQNYPNPFNPSTRIRFRVANSEFVELKVFDILGREVAKLVNEELKPGSYEVAWDAIGLASGVYLYRLQAGDFVETKKLLLLR